MHMSGPEPAAGTMEGRRGGGEAALGAGKDARPCYSPA
jgi:hypothetical protein